MNYGWGFDLRPSRVLALFTWQVNILYKRGMTNIASKANDGSWLASPFKVAQFIIAVFVLLVATMPASVLAAAPGTVTLNTPANGDQLANSDALEFSWAEETQSATWYYIWVNR